MKKIEIAPSTLLIYAFFLVGFVMALYTIAALPTMVNETVAVTQKNRIQKELKDAYNAVTK
jgi:hypothetical protein